MNFNLNFNANEWAGPRLLFLAVSGVLWTLFAIVRGRLQAAAEAADLLAALRQVGRELRFSHPVLSRELMIAHQHAQLHSLESAMKLWADRAGTPEVTNLSLILVQSEQLGTDAATTLTEMSNNLRTTA